MKKILTLSLLVLSAAILAACNCHCSKKHVAINAAPTTLAEAVSQSDKSCTADTDCAPVKKGCCMCDGYEVVNVKAVEPLQKTWEKQCQLAACTMQMCYVELTPSCKNNICTGTPKPMEDYFSK